MKVIYAILAVFIISGCHETKVLPKESYYKHDSVVTNLAGMDFAPIPPGSFLMGIPDGYRGSIGGKNPRHKVTITQGFYLQTTEITQDQWYKVTGYNPSHFKKCGKDCPVERVSWDDITGFISLLSDLDDNYNYRLPTEAEWEYAARANTQGPYYFGDCLSTYHANFEQRYLNHETMS
jgi:formylglycine-generating enzyme required for sulfatase activity